MKIYLRTVAGLLALTSVSTGLQAITSADISKVEKQQLRSQPREMTSEIDGRNRNSVASENQSQSPTVEKSATTITEAYLEQVRITSRQQAAGAAYNLSIIAASRKNLRLASTLIEESIALNPSNPEYLTYASDLAFIAQEYDKAEAYQVMLLELAKAELGLDDLQVAMILDQLGAIYVAQEHYEEADSSLQASLQLRENVLGASHILVVVSLNKLASLAVFQDRSALAESLLKKSLDITREVSGPRHANSAIMLANLADLYHSESRLKEAEALYEEAISIWNDLPGDKLKRAIVQNSLGQLFLRQQRFEDARLQFEQVLVLLKQNYTEDHPYVQQAKRNLTDLNTTHESNVKKDRIYDELVRELGPGLSKHKGVAADVTPSLPEKRIMQF